MCVFINEINRITKVYRQLKMPGIPLAFLIIKNYLIILLHPYCIALNILEAYLQRYRERIVETLYRKYM